MSEKKSQDDCYCEGIGKGCGCRIDDYNKGRQAVLDALPELIKQIENDLMYDFPKHYNNYHIMAYQRGLNMFAKAIVGLWKENNEKG